MPVNHARFVTIELVLLVVAVVLAVIVHAVRTALPGDLGLAELVQLLLPHKRLTDAIEALSTIGWPQYSGPLLGVIVVALLALRRRLGALCALLVAGGADGSSYLANEIIRRPRPQAPGLHVLRYIDNYYSFPSGHVVHFTALFGFVLFLTYQPKHRPSWLVPLRIVLALWVVLMGLSRVLEGEHWPSDVLEGYVLGALWLIALVHLYRWLWHRYPRLQGRGEHDDVQVLPLP